MRRLYYRLCIIKTLLDVISPSIDMPQHLRTLLSQFPMIDVTAMGFIANWQSEPLWK